MSVDLRQIGQLSLFEQVAWRTTVQIEPNHRVVTLCKSISWNGGVSLLPSLDGD